jgi:ABC-type multidrug transport system ATPase subunit
MISVNAVSKRFARVQALDRVSLKIRAGERVAIVGPNGSGKTTLLRTLVGLIAVEGSVEIDGIDVARAPERALAKVAYAPQIAPPIDAPVEELVRLQGALRGITRASVAQRTERLGLDLAAIARTRFRDLSGGMKQKLLAALALAAEAPILICDEPTANLDAHARASFFAQIEERPRDGVLVLCSHRVDEVRHMVDRVIELRDGRVSRDASISDLLDDLRSTRIEVKASGAACITFLLDRGFQRIGEGRFGGTFHQAEKLELIGDLLELHNSSVVDLSIFDDGEVTGFAGEPASERRRVA